VKKAIAIILLLLSLCACEGKLEKQQDEINHSTDGGPGSWQCIQGWGDQSRCDD
jgi:hypothetical protein